MAMTIKGPWSAEQAAVFLEAARMPIRLACIGADGFPRVVSLWYRYEGGSFYCVTHRDAKLTALLQGNTKVGFITAETGDEITLRDMASHETVVQKSDVTGRSKLPISMMPPGLMSNFTVKEFASLLDYLDELAAKQ